MVIDHSGGVTEMIIESVSLIPRAMGGRFRRRFGPQEDIAKPNPRRGRATVARPYDHSNVHSAETSFSANVL